jgi:Rrf2 family protein
LKRLAKAGVLMSLRGPRGGYRLARPAEAISLLEVMEISEGPIQGQVPAVGHAEAAALDKRLEAECAKLAKLTRGVLGRFSIKDLTGMAK